MRILAGPASQFLFGDLLSFFTRLPDSGIIDSLAQPVSFWRLALSFYLGLLVVLIRVTDPSCENLEM